MSELSDKEDRKKLMGERIRRIWIDSKLTQSAFAKSLHVSTVTLLNYMKGTRVPDVFFIISLRQKYHVRFYWILRGRGDTYRSDERSKQTTDARSEEVAVLTTKVEALEKLLASKDKTLQTMEELLGVYRERQGNAEGHNFAVPSSARIARSNDCGDEHLSGVDYIAPRPPVPIVNSE